MHPDARARRQLPTSLVVTAIVLLVAAAAISVAPPVRAVIARVIAVVSAAGPVWFFSAMAVIPAPMAWFTVPAGDAFGPQLTIPGVILAGCAAAGVQIILWYWVARTSLRPLVERLARARGYTVPVVTRDNAVSVVLMVRLVPGPPLPLQCLLLGAARVPFGKYLLVSWLVTVPWVVAGVVLGHGLLGGNITFAALGVSLVAAVLIARHLVRQRMTSRAAA